MNLGKLFGLLCAVLCLLGAPGTGHAISYLVNQTVGASSITGTIETDGTIGLLGAANITDFNLFLADPQDSETFLAGPSVVTISGTGLTATATDILFDFSGANSSWVLFNGPGSDIWCIEDADRLCTGNASTQTVRVSILGSHTQSESGVVAIATVPEPSTALLLVSGLVALAVRRQPPV